MIQAIQVLRFHLLELEKVIPNRSSYLALHNYRLKINTNVYFLSAGQIKMDTDLIVVELEMAQKNAR